MTAPRQLKRGTTYLVTRACLFGRFRLRPGPLPNQIFRYVLARAAQATGIRVHAGCVMSNHYHLVVTDPLGRLPAFHQLLDNEVARALNSLHGQSETFWRPGSYNAVALDSPEVVVDKCAYVLANPVSAGLVRRARKWPGVWTPPEDFGTTLEIERPGHFFDQEGCTPRSVRLQLTAPPGFASTEDFRARVREALAKSESEAARQRTGFLGVARVLAQRVLDQPRRPKPLWSLKPRFAARDPGRRILLARMLRAFLTEYRTALEAWQDGQRSVRFPDGTYQMRVLHRAECAGAG